jgi:hypothetical protein
MGVGKIVPLMRTLFLIYNIKGIMSSPPENLLAGSANTGQHATTTNISHPNSQNISRPEMGVNKEIQKAITSRNQREEWSPDAALERALQPSSVIYRYYNATKLFPHQKNSNTAHPHTSGNPPPEPFTTAVELSPRIDHHIISIVIRWDYSQLP